jgi:hypothetical protein
MTFSAGELKKEDYLYPRRIEENAPQFAALLLRVWPTPMAIAAGRSKT